ncbi:transcription elongation factor S-II protein [Oesophagostomum dentatum]|uniref:Transcription elongation factor S-II protein n=1 Tax=Oesophagostomum dentatum TaxID=61180 RepID=A0A0B1TJ69_OESDE|nr:transcription elongation factor S-II protein [Oesophagostomum dentatum]
MTVDDAVLNKVIKYGKLIKKKEKVVAHALSRLNNIDMTLEILSATNIGRYVNRLCHDLEFGNEASRIIEKWKEIARQSGVRGGDEDPASGDDEPSASSHPRDSWQEDGRSNGDFNEDHSPRHEEFLEDDRKTGEGRKRHYEEMDEQGHLSDGAEQSYHLDSDEGSHAHQEKRSRNSERSKEDGANDATADRKSSSRSSSSKESKKKERSLDDSDPSQRASSSKTPTKSSNKKAVTEFDMILLSADSSQPKHKKPRDKDSHLKWTEMPLLANYQPFPQAARAVKDANAPPAEDFNPENMFKPRNERGKVFAGRRKNTIMTVPSLFNLCLRVLSNHIEVLLYADYVPYDVLKPVLEKCNEEQLACVESKHPYIEDDSGELWQRFVNRKYPGEEPSSDGTWKELYYILEREKEDKLKRLSKRIGKLHQADSAKGQRKTILADATAPTSVRRRQMQHGIAHASRPLPSAIEVSHARRRIFETGGSKDALSALPSSVVNRNSTVGAKTDRHAKKAPAKKGALMIKTMKMLNMKRR